MNKRAGCLHIFRQYGFAVAKKQPAPRFPKVQAAFFAIQNITRIPAGGGAAR
ncbi:hypothetical protein [Kingella denitrificans]